MEQMTPEEMKKRLPLIKLFQLLKEKREELQPNWVKIFEEGKIEQVEQLHKHTLKTVESQLKNISELIKSFEAQEKEVSKKKKDAKHLDYTELIKAHLNFAEDSGEIIKKEELDASKILYLFKNLWRIITQQESALKKIKGTGPEAYQEPQLREAFAKEVALVKNIKVFWNDWEEKVLLIEELTAKLGNTSYEEIEQMKHEIETLLRQLHADFSDNGRAAQIGTELAINLYLNETKEIQKAGGVPVAIINIDMTSCNELDGSHGLGDALIDVCYKTLSENIYKVKPYFTKTKEAEGGQLTSTGAVTIFGRTKFKIVGITKDVLVKALKTLPDVMLDRIKSAPQARNVAAQHGEDALDRINTTMLAGYSIVKVSPVRGELIFARKTFDDITQKLETAKKKNVILNESENTDTSLRKQIADLEASKNEVAAKIKNIETSIANLIDQGLKEAAAKAEYLEKNELPKIKDKVTNQLADERKKAGLPMLPGPEFAEQTNAVFKKYVKTFPYLLLYDDHIDKAWLGRNYIPEAEFEGLMIQRLSHQMGLDIKLTEEFFDIFDKVRRLSDPKKLGEDDLKKLEVIKNSFYSKVLQKRHVAKSYDLRFTLALREESYDNVIAAASLLEGPQIITFIEIDGFNAFNRIYRPDSEDTYYHLILKRFFQDFDYVFNKGVEEEKKIKLRMTKQGDEIWISYPAKTILGDANEKKHVEFLKRVRESLIFHDQRALETANLKTVDWIPYLIRDFKEMNEHLVNCISHNREVKYVDNAEFKISEEQKKEHQIVTPNTSTSFWGFIPFVVKMRPCKDEENFNKWKLLKNARQVTGNGKFGVTSFKYSELLFDELTKLTIGEVAKRVLTGRIIRLGTTMGYVGFKKPVMKEKPKDVEVLRKILNESIEHMRNTKGRGNIYNLEKEMNI